MQTRDQLIKEQNEQYRQKRLNEIKELTAKRMLYDIFYNDVFNLGIPKDEHFNSKEFWGEFWDKRLCK